MPTIPGSGRATATTWQRSTFCGSDACVEVSVGAGSIAVRDAKDDNSPVLTFTSDEWSAFVKGVKSGEFDLA